MNAAALYRACRFIIRGPFFSRFLSELLQDYVCEIRGRSEDKLISRK